MISLKEIGRICGVSESTVSKALKDHPKVNEKTKRLVKDVAERNGYHPNALVHSMQSGRSMTIGVIHPTFLDRFYGSIFYAIYKEAAAKGYDCMGALWESCEAGGGRKLLSTLASRRVDGLLLFPRPEATDPDFVSAMRLLKIPAVYIDCLPSTPEFAFVSNDNFMGGIMQTELLISRGLKRIGCVHCNVPGFTANQERFEGHCEAMRRHGLPTLPSLSLDFTGLGKKQKQEAFKALLAPGRRPEGLVCDTDYTAIGLLAIANDCGVKVPEELSVVGFGNINFIAELARPQLTSFDQNPEGIGRLAAATLIEQIEGKRDIIMEHKLPVNLVERDSVRPAPGNSTESKEI